MRVNAGGMRTAQLPIERRLSLTKVNKLRERLEAYPFSDLGAMMEGYAQGAVEMARKEYRQTLDFSAESINGLDEILVLASEDPNIDLDYESRLWGSYLGEVLRRRYAGSWEMTQYPGGAVALPIGKEGVGAGRLAGVGEFGAD